jgi:hypothetical protein
MIQPICVNYHGVMNRSPECLRMCPERRALAHSSLLTRTSTWAKYLGQQQLSATTTAISRACMAVHPSQCIPSVWLYTLPEYHVSQRTLFQPLAYFGGWVTRSMSRGRSSLNACVGYCGRRESSVQSD